MIYDVEDELLGVAVGVAVGVGVGDGVGVGVGVGPRVKVKVGVGDGADDVGLLCAEEVLVVGLGAAVGLLVPLLLPWPGAEPTADGAGLLLEPPVLCGLAVVGSADWPGAVLPVPCVVPGDAEE